MLARPACDVDALSDTRTGGAIMWFGGDAIMAAVMIGAGGAAGCAASNRAPAEQGWLEQARAGDVQPRTPARRRDRDATSCLDDDDAARAAYNEWLAKLDAAATLTRSPAPAVRLLDADARTSLSRSWRRVGAERDVGVGVQHAGDLRQPAGDDVGDRVELAHPHDRRSGRRRRRRSRPR